MVLLGAEVQKRWVMSPERPEEVLAGDRDVGAINSVILGH